MCVPLPLEFISKLRLVNPNGVTLILPGDISASQLEQYIHRKDVSHGKDLCQTDDACERAAMMYSFFGACKVKGKNPERWLTYVLDHIKETKDEDMYKLLPEFWEDQN